MCGTTVLGDYGSNLIKAFPSLKLPSQMKNISHTHTHVRAHTQSWTVRGGRVQYGFSENLCFLRPESHPSHSKAYRDVWVADLTLASLCMVIGQQAVHNILEGWNNSAASFAFFFFFFSRIAEEKCNCIKSELNKMSAGTLTFKVPATTPTPHFICLIRERFLISIDEAPVCLLSIHLFTTHNTSCTQNRGKLRPRRFAVLTLLCSNVTISRNQISCLSVLNIHIYMSLNGPPNPIRDCSFPDWQSCSRLTGRVYSWSVCVW